jgi:hypothetical protein
VSIFKWYEKDFINDFRANGHPAARGLTDNVAEMATGSLRDDLDRPMATTLSSGITTGI